MPEPIFEVDLPAREVKREILEMQSTERPLESERVTADEVLKIVEHDPFVFFRGSNIPLSTDFTERVLHSSLTQWAPDLPACAR